MLQGTITGLLVLIVSFWAIGTGYSATDEGFYRGKTIRMIVAFARAAGLIVTPGRLVGTSPSTSPAILPFLWIT